MMPAATAPALEAHPEPREGKRPIPADITARKPMHHEESAQASGFSHWAAIVERIKQNDPGAMEEFYVAFSRGVRYYLCRQLSPQEIDDKVHDTFLIVVQAIQRGDLREPERLMGFVRTVVRRQVAAHIDHAVSSRREMVEVDSAPNLFDLARSPEETAIVEQRIEIMREVLAELSERDREILSRFYVKEQTQAEICRDMGLTETQFRLLKSRAKTRFGEIGKRLLVTRNLSNMVKAAGAE
jgi:RNA polymerase sigma-70 factor (ECF subfamily)